ncbi:MAG: hypothetical protein QOH62_3787 [Solirubrobacteraceae bacterium]|nr:hypothetical protein [Solirubrobacteraceae bacterium]
MSKGSLGVVAVAIAAFGVLLGAPELSTGAGACDTLARIAPAAGCPTEVVQTTVNNLVPPPAAKRPAARPAAPRQAADPTVTPPSHGTNPHGQGQVAVADTSPDPKRPYSSDPTGKTDNEEVVVGRSRGEQGANGSYHGHITVAALFGNEIAGVDTNAGDAKHGPLDAVQTNLLDAICEGSGNQICLSVLTADSTTTSSGSTNRFSVAHAKVGGDSGLETGVAESNGNISGDGNCQASHGDSQVADVKAGGSPVASLAKSSTDSNACRGQAPSQSNTSSVLALGGTGVPIPAAGCADGTPDTATGVPTILPMVCNADDTNAGQSSDPYGVRDALDVFLLATGTTSAAKVTTSGSGSHAVAPAENGGPQCSDGVDNDGDGLIDAADPGCHSDGNPNNPASYEPGDDSEANGGVVGQGAGAAKPQCSDGKDNDGDGLVDAKDPGCHSDGNPGNASSYNPDDDNEANGDNGVKSVGAGGDAPTGAVRASSGNLPFTGTDLLVNALIGALLVAAGLAIRSRLPRRGGDHC